MNRVAFMAALVVAPFVLAPWRAAKALAFGWLVALVLLGLGSWVTELLGFVCALTVAVAFGKKLGRAHAAVAARAEEDVPDEPPFFYGLAGETAEGELAVMLALDTVDPQYVLGFQTGRLWEAAYSDQPEVDERVPVSLAEMVVRIADATRRPFRAVPLNDDWLHVRMGPVGADDLVDEDA